MLSSFAQDDDGGMGSLASPTHRARGKPRWRVTLLVNETLTGAETPGHKIILPVPQSLLLNAACPEAAAAITEAAARGARIRAVFNACPLSRLAVSRDEVHFRIPPEIFSSVHSSGQYSAKLLVQADDEPWQEFTVDVTVAYRPDVSTAVKEGVTLGRDAYLADCVAKLDLFPFAMEVFLKGFLHQRRLQFVLASSEDARDAVLRMRDPVFDISVRDVLVLRPELGAVYDLPCPPDVEATTVEDDDTEPVATPLALEDRRADGTSTSFPTVPLPSKPARGVKRVMV
jgi:hypothetical protein